MFTSDEEQQHTNELRFRRGRRRDLVSTRTRSDLENLIYSTQMFVVQDHVKSILQQKNFPSLKQSVNQHIEQIQNLTNQVSEKENRIQHLQLQTSQSAALQTLMNTINEPTIPISTFQEALTNTNYDQQEAIYYLIQQDNKIQSLINAIDHQDNLPRSLYRTTLINNNWNHDAAFLHFEQELLQFQETTIPPPPTIPNNTLLNKQIVQAQLALEIATYNLNEYLGTGNSDNTWFRDRPDTNQLKQDPYVGKRSPFKLIATTKICKTCNHTMMNAIEAKSHETQTGHTNITNNTNIQIKPEDRLTLLHNLLSAPVLPHPILNKDERQHLINQISNALTFLNKQQHSNQHAIDDDTTYEYEIQHLENNSSYQTLLKAQSLHSVHSLQHSSSHNFSIVKSMQRLINNASSTSSTVPSDWGTKLNQQVYTCSSMTAIWYYISPICFTLCGVYQLYLLKTLESFVSSTYPWRFEAYLLIVQGGMAWWSDVYDLGKSSVSHICDRIMAPVMVLWFMMRTVLMLGIIDNSYFTHEMHSATYVLLFVTFPISIWIHLQGIKANLRLDYEGYVYWHGVWHISLPLFGMLYGSLMVYLNE